MKMFPFAKLFIEIIDNSQTKRVRDLKILPDLEQGLKTKISIFAKGNILRCSLLQNDGSAVQRPYGTALITCHLPEHKPLVGSIE